MIVKVPFLKLILSLFFMSSLILSAQNIWEKEVYLNIEDKPLRYILDELRNKTGINFIYKSDLADSGQLSVDIRSSTEKILETILKDKEIAFKKFSNNSCVLYKNKIPEQNKFESVVIDEVDENDFNSVNSGIKRPILLTKTEFKYPALARLERLEGEVQVNVLIDNSGNVAKAVLEKSSGHRILDTTTLTYVKNLKYLPAEFNGKPYKVWTTLFVKYNILDENTDN